jgi:hypothetical protein
MAMSDQELALRLRVVNIALGLLQRHALLPGAPDTGVVAVAANTDGCVHTGAVGDAGGSDGSFAVRMSVYRRVPASIIRRAEIWCW